MLAASVYTSEETETAEVPGEGVMAQELAKHEADAEKKRLRLRQIRSARNRLFVCFCTFPVYVLAVMRVLEAGNETTLIMVAYMALYAGFGVALANKRCPDCHEQYFVKTFFLNPFRSRCAHCGCPLHSEASLGA